MDDETPDPLAIAKFRASIMESGRKWDRGIELVREYEANPAMSIENMRELIDGFLYDKLPIHTLLWQRKGVFDNYDRPNPLPRI